MKRLLALLFLLFALPAYGADVAQNAVTDGSATVADTHYLSGYTGTTSQRYTIASILALKTSVSGTSGGLSGTPNITVGTISAGATGFSVDADGDTTVKSLNIGRTAGVTSILDLFEIPANGDNKISIKPPDALAADAVITTPGVTCTLAPVDSPSFTTTIVTPQVDLGTNGVRITHDSDGAITLLGLGDGYDEDLKFNLDDTENTVVVSSSTGVTDLNLSALNLVTTGTIQGGVKVASDADGMDGTAMTAAGMYGTMFIATGAGTWTLPTAVAGMSICLMDSGTAHDLILDVQADDDIQLKGTEQANGVGITNASGSTTGDLICVIAISAGHWATVGGGSGTWASQ